MSLKYNSGNFTIDPEKVVIDKLYCFTFNPQIQPLDVAGSKGVNNSLWQFSPHDDLVFNLKPWYVACVTLFESLKGAIVKDMVVEISPKGRYHFHGRIAITDVMLFYTFDIPILEAKAHYYICEQLGEAPSDKKTEYKTWDEYLQKQQSFMKPFLKKYGIDEKTDMELSNKYIINRQGRLKERSKEVFDKKCRICKVEYKTDKKKSIVCTKCEKLNHI